jgi:hypothetical protein
MHVQAFHSNTGYQPQEVFMVSIALAAQWLNAYQKVAVYAQRRT